MSPHPAADPRQPAAHPTAPAAAASLDALRAILVPKTCDVLAQRLQQQILGGAFPPGSMLPPERELVSMTGLSRTSVREALRILEAQGLVQTRPGRYGGSTVCRPTDALLANHIALFARGLSVPLRALVEARQAVEPMIAALAARNRTDDDLRSLEQIAARLDAAAADDVPAFLQTNAQWHTALAVACHNDLLRAFAASISGMMLDASRIEGFASPDVRMLVTFAHRRILAAIVAQDAEAARRRAERDIQAYARHLAAALEDNGQLPSR